MNNKRQTALVVLSGGQDSTTCLYWALKNFIHVRAVTFDYGQRHKCEIEAAQQIVDLAGIGPDNHEVVTLDTLAGRSPLTDPSAELETYVSPAQMAATIGDRVELTFVPMRNAVFMTYAANRAIAAGIYDLVLGVCQEDNANYPDCRQSYVWAMEHAINLALGLDRTGVRFNVHTPLMTLTKAKSVDLAVTLGAYYALGFSHTAYSGEYPPETQDHATVLRAKGFEEANLPDPLILRAWCAGLIELPPTRNYDRMKGIYDMTPLAYAEAVPEVVRGFLARLEVRGGFAIKSPPGVAYDVHHGNYPSDGLF